MTMDGSKKIVKVKYWLFKQVHFMSIIFLSLQSCEKSEGIKDSYIDPHIIFSSYRWWNYDIFISDIYGAYSTHPELLFNLVEAAHHFVRGLDYFGIHLIGTLCRNQFGNFRNGIYV